MSALMSVVYVRHWCPSERRCRAGRWVRAGVALQSKPFKVWGYRGGGKFSLHPLAYSYCTSILSLKQDRICISKIICCGSIGKHRASLSLVCPPRTHHIDRGLLSIIVWRWMPPLTTLTLHPPLRPSMFSASVDVQYHPPLLVDAVGTFRNGCPGCSACTPG